MGLKKMRKNYYKRLGEAKEAGDVKLVKKLERGLSSCNSLGLRKRHQIDANNQKYITNPRFATKDD